MVEEMTEVTRQTVEQETENEIVKPVEQRKSVEHIENISVDKFMLQHQIKM